MKRLLASWADLNERQQLAVAASGLYLLVVGLVALLAHWLPMAFGPNQLDLYNPYLEPGFGPAQDGHWLGTDAVGRDVLANVIFGFRTGLFIAVPVMVVSLGLGTVLGSLAGFYGNGKLKISRATVFSACLSLFLLFFYGFYLRRFAWQQPGEGVWAKEFLRFAFLAVIASGLGFALKALLKRVGFLRKKVKVPFDELVLKTSEFLTTVPRLVLILCLAAVLSPGAGSLILLLCLTYWVGSARLARTETLRLKPLPFIEAAQVAGLPDRKILFRHILVNAAGPLITAFCFGLGGLLGLESALSFIGVGLPPETPSWGRLLAGVRLNPDAWWLLLFPGLALWFTILSLQTAGNFLKKAVANR